MTSVTVRGRSLGGLARPSDLGALVLLALLIGCGGQPQTGLRYQDARLTEPSGLAASRANPGVFWTHNDSGDGPVLYAVTADGRLLARYRVTGARAIDWESITLGDDGFLYIGDIGNNGSDRRDLRVYRVAEPSVSLAALEPGGEPVAGELTVDRTLAFHYPEQTQFPSPARNFDAEALFWAPHPDSGRGTLYLLTKHRGDQATVLYRFDGLDRGSLPLTRRGTFTVGGDPDRYGGMVTGADATPDGRLLAVLTYHALFLFERPATGDDYLQNPRNRIDFDQDITLQAEAVAWDGDVIVFTNEQGAIFRLDEPLAPRAGRYPAPTPPSPPSSTR